VTSADRYEAFRCTGPFETSFEMCDKITGELVMLAVIRDSDNILIVQQLHADLPAELVEWFKVEAQRQLLPASGT
jgi:hypothetical protein